MKWLKWVSVLDHLSIYTFLMSEHISVFISFSFFLSHVVVSLAEQRQRLAADKRRREYHEEQRNQFENYAEEESDGE